MLTTRARFAIIGTRPCVPKEMSMHAVVTLYSKPSCSLCDDARDALMRVQKMQPFTLQDVNIETDPQLFAEYGEQIPVVLLNGTFLFEYEVDEARLRQLLTEVN